MIKVKFDWAKNKFGTTAASTGPTAAGGGPGSGAPAAGRDKSETKPLASSGGPAGGGPGLGQAAAQRDLNGGAGGASGAPSASPFYEEELSNSRGSATSFGGAGSAFSTATPSAGGATQTCCLVEDQVRCQRSAGNASYSKRIQKTVQQKSLRLAIDTTARHIYICDHHKGRPLPLLPSLASPSALSPLPPPSFLPRIPSHPIPFQA